MTEVYVHLGLHKTGTTFLQKEVFPKIEKSNFNFIDSQEISMFSDRHAAGRAARKWLLNVLYFDDNDGEMLYQSEANRE